MAGPGTASHEARCSSFVGAFSVVLRWFVVLMVSYTVYATVSHSLEIVVKG